MMPAFEPVAECWVCGGVRFTRVHLAPFDFHQFEHEDADLFAYGGLDVWIARCADCGFGQPERLPSLPRFFDRMYAQRWSEEWIAGEYDATYKDLIFATILKELDRRLGARVPRTLLDIGAHAGRFLSLAQRTGWTVEGIELNPRTAEYAGRRTGASVSHMNVRALQTTGRRYGAVTLTDVLEHIPQPVNLLATVSSLVEAGGCVAVKVPSGPAQAFKERMLAALTKRRVSLADNLVHVNHFSPRSLALALARAGLVDVAVGAGAPELPVAAGAPGTLSNAVRRIAYAAARLPGAVHTPLALNLQAYGSRP
ncbi:MAG TPA: methyltransferase domain-containing protein [Vicinamibacterales bacterium]|nr:methyltransferase domain-containing protein [Vicinamibacterales bacterium]